MSVKRRRTDSPRKVHTLSDQGTEAYENWDVDQAVKFFEAAHNTAPDDADISLDLAKALARGGNFDRALQALADFLRLEPDSPLADRFEHLFASGMDSVEQMLTEKMTPFSNSSNPVYLLPRYSFPH